jgi:hypothetical protein
MYQILWYNQPYRDSFLIDMVGCDPPIDISKEFLFYQQVLITVDFYLKILCNTTDRDYAEKSMYNVNIFRFR